MIFNCRREVIPLNDGEKITLQAHLVQRVSKNGVPYVALNIELFPNVNKLVFLDNAEVALLEINK